MLKRTVPFSIALLYSLITLVFASEVGAKCAWKATSRAANDSELEQEIATLMRESPNQRRSSLTYNAILSRVARERAYDMAQRNYFSHVNPDGIGPNYLVVRAGYALPDFYGKEESANNIESIASGNETAAATWTQWMRSPGHREHVLGLTDFYAAQTDYGVGHAFVSGSRFEHYWVVITAKPGEASSSPAQIRSGTTGMITECDGSGTNYPHVVRSTSGKLVPACGYEWLSDESSDYRVRLMEGLMRTETGLRPSSGYVWVNDDPNDYRVKLMLGLIRTGAGKLLPASGYRWVRPDDPEDLRVEPIPKS